MPTTRNYPGEHLNARVSTIDEQRGFMAREVTSYKSKGWRLVET